MTTLLKVAFCVVVLSIFGWAIFGDHETPEESFARHLRQVEYVLAHPEEDTDTYLLILKTHADQIGMWQTAPDKEIAVREARTLLYRRMADVEEKRVLKLHEEK